MKYLIAAAILFCATEALACSCVRMTREQTIAKADAVVKGTVEEVQRTPEMYGTITARLRVLERIKGTVADTITVKTAGQSAACGIDLPKGATLELALHESAGIYRASSCAQIGLNAKPN